jgi:hypothetical protein
MAIGKKKSKQQETMWVATRDLPTSPGRPFYQRLNRILEMHSFDRLQRRPRNPQQLAECHYE